MDIVAILFGSTAASCVLGVVLVGLFYWYSTRGHGIWKQKGIPFEKPLPVFGGIIQNISKPMQVWQVENHNKHGPIFGFYEGNGGLGLSVADPKLLRNILVKDFQFFTNRRALETSDTIAECMLQNLQGEHWKRVRTIVTPTFTTGKIKRMMEIFKSCSKVLVQNFRNVADGETPVEVKKIYGAFTMDVIASAAFSTKLDSHSDPNNEFLVNARILFSGNINWRFVVYRMFPSLLRIFKVPVFPPQPVKFFSKVTLQIMEERKRTGQVGNDFLQLLLDTAKEHEEEKTLENEDKADLTTNNYEEETNDQVFKNVNTKKSLSFHEVVAQCVIFFLAGYDTTASTLSYATHCLALNQDVQNKLREEVDQALKDSNGELTYEAVQGMKYLDNVISETLRMYPPANKLERITEVDYALGDTGVTIPKGTVINVPVYALHRDPKFYPNPQVFYPERFSPEERAKRVPYTYLPFGGGPRNCVAMRFALVEAKVCLVQVISNFLIKRSPEAEAALQQNKSQGLVLSKDVTVLLEVRKDGHMKA